MNVSDQLPAPVALLQGTVPGTYCWTGGSVGRRVGLETRQNKNFLTLMGIETAIPRLSISRSPSLNQLI
jgi:hypothetical protein